MRRVRVVSGKKLLIASVGIAAASYVGCSSVTSGNLICTDCGTTTASGSGGNGGAGGSGSTGGSGGAPDGGDGG
jgi:hypothetical protein